MAKVWLLGCTDGEAIGGTQWPSFGSSASAGASGTTASHDIGTAILNRRPGTLSKLVSRVAGNTRTDAMKLRLRYNDGAAVGTMENNYGISSGAMESDVAAGSDAIADGDYLQWEWLAGAGSGTLTQGPIGCQFVPDGPTAEWVWTNGEKVTVNQASATRYLGPFGSNSHTTDENSMRVRVEQAMSVVAFSAQCFTNLRTTDIVLTLRKNNGDTAAVVTIPAGAATSTDGTAGIIEWASTPITFAQGDYLSVKMTTGTGTEVAELTVVAITCVSDSNYFQLGAQGVQSVAAGATEYVPFAGSMEASTTTQSRVQCRAPFAMRLDRFRGYVRTNSVSAASTVHLMVNGSSVWSFGASDDWDASGTGEADDNASFVDIAEGDEVCWALEAGAGGTTIEFRSMACRAIALGTGSGQGVSGGMHQLAGGMAA